MPVNVGGSRTLQFIGLAAGGTQELVAPADGWLEEIRTVVAATVSTTGAITVKTGDALGVTVAGLTVSPANSAAAGSRLSAAATAGSATRKVSKGDRIQVAAAFTGGSVNGVLVLRTADASPALPPA